MNNKMEKFANSGLIKTMQELSLKLSRSPAFSTISQGMGGTMGLIMIGAVVQILCALGQMAFGWSPGHPIYDVLYMPYELTMGLLGLFMAFYPCLQLCQTTGCQCADPVRIYFDRMFFPDLLSSGLSHQQQWNHDPGHQCFSSGSQRNILRHPDRAAFCTDQQICDRSQLDHPDAGCRSGRHLEQL